MKLTKDHIDTLLSWGVSKEDIAQIEEATGKTVYTLYEAWKLKGRISTKKAIEILGIETYLSGIYRSAFHWTSTRENGKYEVLFGSSRLFK